MLARIRKAQEEREGGFTLIELLVVMIIIGILAAIAIPVFLNQRKSGYDAGAKSDVRNAATAEETYFTDTQAYTTATSGANSLATSGWKQSAHTKDVAVSTYASVTGGALDSYKIAAVSESGKEFCWDSQNSQKGVYDSGKTGKTTAATTDC